MYWRSAVTVALVALLAAPVQLLPAEPPTPAAQQALTQDEKIVHLLNRIGFGARRGDIERVREMGIDAYVERQLNPQSISDAGVEQRLMGLETLHMTPTQLLVAYPPPQLLRGIERRMSAQMGMDPEASGTLFPELQRRRDRQARQQDGGRGPQADELAMARAERMERAMNSPARIVLELSQAKVLRAIYSERQLQEVMTDFWFNHFNVFVGKGADRWLTTGYEYEAIRPHALGKFRDLLEATASHPAMLFYLDNWQSADPKANVSELELRRQYVAYLQAYGRQPGQLVLEILRQRGADTAEAEQLLERQMRRMEMASQMDSRRGRFGRRRARQQQEAQERRRGLNENYARELLELHTLGVDGGYTQRDVIEVARCFTGWTLLPLQFGQDFVYIDDLHDKGTKVVLGHTIKNGGRRDAEQVLDILARHPSTARFISTKLARRFVSDDPPPALVEQMADTFLKADGDIKAVLRTMLESEEFWSADAMSAKVKTPFEFVVSAARATDAEVSDRPPGLVIALRQLGQPLYAAQPPTGYKDTADAWVSTGGLLNRMKIALGLASNRLPGVQATVPVDWQHAESEDDMVTGLARALLGRPVSNNTKQALAVELERARNENPAAGRGLEARLALGWLLASPEFQRK